MARERQEQLPPEKINTLLSLLERQGKRKWLERWKIHIAIPPFLNPSTDDGKEREYILRYLLLRVLINQQAKAEKVRELCLQLAEEFGELLFCKPFNVSEKALFSLFKKCGGEKGSQIYRVGALGGIKPLSLFAYRFKAYEGFIRWLDEEHKSFFEVINFYILQAKNPKNLFDYLKTHPCLEAGWVGNDPKACRLFVNWVIFFYSTFWGYQELSLKDTLMIVDGHVGKVFCRTGILGEVLYEDERPYIIRASEMRSAIEKVVAESGNIPFYIDNGAFYLFEDGFCTDSIPNCCSCPISEFCKKYIKWTAYQRFTS